MGSVQNLIQNWFREGVSKDKWNLKKVNKEKTMWKQSELLKNLLGWLYIYDPGQDIWNKVKKNTKNGDIYCCIIFYR